ncbi:MAG: SulP family inorganic anion transporter [Clostridium sp.]|uniref:SulP family inorganic anion transporter n=1 Tax=Clostridium sp. TaxID=1506 RepID=UPI002FCB9689
MKPKLFEMIKRGEITKESLAKDFISGVIVAIIALPLSVALGISSGVSPEKGLITAIIAGFIISFLGGSNVQIGGPTGAFVVIVYGIISTYGIQGLIVSTIMAGIIMILLGIFKMGRFIKFVPYPITIGFTAGIAVTLFSTQIKDFLGMNIENIDSSFIGKWSAYLSNLDKVNYLSLGIGILSVLIIVNFKKASDKIPGSLVALIITTLLVYIFKLPVATIGSSFENISSSISFASFEGVDFNMIKSLIGPAFTIALLASVESLLSAVVADSMTGDKHDSNMELIAQGTANIFSGLFGGIPATGAIARTAANVKNGGTSPVSGMIHAICLLLIMLIFLPIAKLIPMTTLAAILIVVSYNMAEIENFKALLKAPKSDVVLLLVTFSLTVVFDLVIAIEVGMVLAAFLFIKSMCEATDIQCVNSISLSNDKLTSITYKINGPLFFGVVQNLVEDVKRDSNRCSEIIIDMRNTCSIDSSGIDALNKIYSICLVKGVRLKVMNIHDQPKHALKRIGFKDNGNNNLYIDFEENLKINA